MSLKVSVRAHAEAKIYDSRDSAWRDSYFCYGIKNVKYCEIAPYIQVYYAKKKLENFHKYSFSEFFKKGPVKRVMWHIIIWDLPNGIIV